jgi:hypothetical protein
LREKNGNTGKIRASLSPAALKGGKLREVVRNLTEDMQELWLTNNPNGRRKLETPEKIVYIYLLNQQET